MGFLDGMIGGMVGAALVPVVNNLLNQHGGVQGIVNQFENKGLGGVANQWVATGPNPPITADHVNQAFGEQTIAQLAAKAGMSSARRRSPPWPLGPGCRRRSCRPSWRRCCRTRWMR
jgi:uncharacterized protein YidB (DUF937 family)